MRSSAFRHILAGFAALLLSGLTLLAPAYASVASTAAPVTAVSR